MSVLYLVTPTGANAAKPISAEGQGQTISVHLAAAQKQDLFPYRAVDLTVTNGGNETVQSVRIRMVQGGPRYVFAALTAPQSTSSATVYLPAMTLEQVYRVELLGESEQKPKVLAWQDAAVNWDPTMLTPDVFMDGPAYAQYEDSLPAWPGGMLQNAFGALAAASIAIALICLIRAPVVRATGMIVLIAAATVGVMSILNAPTIIARWTGPPHGDPGAVVCGAKRSDHVGSPLAAVLCGAEKDNDADACVPARTQAGRGRSALPGLANHGTGTQTAVAPTSQPSPVAPHPIDTLILSCRRTSNWSYPSANLVPVYRDGQQLATDNTIIDARTGVLVRISPDEIRIFRLFTDLPDKHSTLKILTSLP